MGCDIHLHMERSEANDGLWFHFASYDDLGRDYDAFGAMAGVRHPDKVIYSPRGLPDDVSWGTRNAWNDGMADWHTPSWLSPDEFEIATKNPYRWMAVEAVLASARVIESAGNAVRLVFWFDN